MTTPGAQPTGSSAGEDRPSHLGRVHRPSRPRSWEPMRPSSRPPLWRPEQPVPRFRTWTYIRIQGWRRYVAGFGFAEPCPVPAARYARTTREHRSSPGSARRAGPIDPQPWPGRCRTPCSADPYRAPRDLRPARRRAHRRARAGRRRRSRACVLRHSFRRAHRRGDAHARTRKKAVWPLRRVHRSSSPVPPAHGERQGPTVRQPSAKWGKWD